MDQSMFMTSILYKIPVSFNLLPSPPFQYCISWSRLTGIYCFRSDVELPSFVAVGAYR